MDEKRLPELLRLVNNLAGRFDANQQQLDNLSTDIRQGKSFIARQPALLSFLQQLQSLMQEKTTAQFGDLLTAFVDDVLNNGKRIALDLGNSHGMPTVKIEAINNGWRESIIDGSGAMTNIVSTGLRLIALSRIQGRKFIVLDETECWTMPERIGDFYKVINEIARTLKVQVLVISHHQSSNFQHLGRVIRFAKEGGAVISETIIDNGEMNGDNDIKEIHLRNFMSHRDTVVPLHPALTFIIGANDIGKSALVLALRYLSYGDSDDNCIRHGENSATVSVAFDQNKRVVWSRVLQTNDEQKQKVRFQLFDDGSDNPSHDAYEAHESPVFVQKALGIQLHNDLDIQIGNQKDPMFLIGPLVKATDRAKILSVGKETVLLAGMMEALRDKTRLQKSDIKTKEQLYDKLNRENEHLQDIKKMAEQAQSLGEQQKMIANEQQKNWNANNLFQKFSNAHQKAILKPISASVTPPILQDIEKARTVLKQLKTTQIKTNTPILGLPQALPMLKDAEHGYNLMLQLRAQKIKSSLMLIIDTEAPILKETESPQRVFDALLHNQKIQTELADKKTRLIEWQQHLEEETKILLKGIGDVCPLCHQHASAEHFLKENHAHI